MSDVIKKIEEFKLIPVIKINTPDEARPVAEALAKGGLPIAEVTFRTDAAEEAIKIMHEEYPGIFLGAGTVTNVSQARRAIAAGAQFLVGPGFSAGVAEVALKEMVTYIPGVCTPTEIISALEYGIHVVKFFPAKACGGLDYLKAVSAAFPEVRFIPTGGVSEANICDYLAFDKVIACGGTWIVENKLISEKNFEKIERLIEDAVALIK